ncbi:hypothetical protein [Anabaena lutea]|uniref:Uncharacterized protein n=1 Tax=Anabaena lutea FACHB-196 TaxID=2692881 RepID=A0ABR8FKJ5_9NOST|nr:hypothetical protein [Anabaena lutea]MBD2569707.1 hypothetical protein [Anabaena lutea FACHB-196]
MTIKTITYKRILNLGNYESKHLEMTYEIEEHDDPLVEASRLMTTVEYKLREDQSEAIRQEINSLRQELRVLKGEQRELLKQTAKESDVEDFLNAREDVSEGGLF